ncbi:MAG: DUF6288 domain-containing protein, partial [Verrucomicrobiota bacterium]
RAITRAEANDGRLHLLRWRKGETDSVVVVLDTPGAYASTAPYDCKKSQWIVERGCEAIVANLKKPDGRRRHPIVRSLNTLALLATGDDQYLPLIKEEIEWAKTFEIQEGDLHSWPAGWVTLLLAEYRLVTGDKSVDSSLQRLCYEIAEGQSNVGTWGHRFAYDSGILRGYGAMNQLGLSLTTSLILAQEAGIDEPRVAEAIEKSRMFLSFYAGRGAIPYGDHHPWLEMHDDNGKASAAALMFDLLGDTEEAEFFSRMATASYGVERETGHTGNFFNMLWALPAVSRSGPEATGAWVSETAWLLDLARKHDGSFDFLGKPAATGGEHSYKGWDCTGAYVLGYLVGAQKLRFTGAGNTQVRQLTENQAAEIIEEGRGWTPATKAASYEARSVENLLESLSSWSPVVRERAALALAKADADLNTLVPQIIAHAKSGDKDRQLGACAALESLGRGSAAAVPVLRDLLKSQDYWVQVQAAEALGAIGEPAKVAIPDMLELVAAAPRAEDGRGYLQRYLAFALFDQRRGLIGRSIDEVDRDLLREAAAAVLKNEDGRARSSLKTVYEMLSDEEIAPLMPAIREAVTNQSPSGVMFSDGVRLAGLAVLVRQKDPAGVPLCIDLIELDRWGSERRVNECLNCLQDYGSMARSEKAKIAAFAQTLYEHPRFNLKNPEARNHNEKMAKHYERLQSILQSLE